MATILKQAPELPHLSSVLVVFFFKVLVELGSTLPLNSYLVVQLIVPQMGRKS